MTAETDLRVVVPFTPDKLHPLADRALRTYAPDAERFDVSASHTAYHQLVEKLWTEGRSFLLVEHDIEIHADVLPQLLACPESWCTFGYAGPGAVHLTQALGCTRFAAQLLADEPDAATAAGTITGDSSLAACDWRRLDTRLLYALRMRDYVPHVHEPDVRHHHEYCGACACRTEHD